MARGADKVPVASLSAPGSSVGRNRLHALASRQESEASIDVVTAVHDSGLDQLVLIEIPRNWISNSPYYFLADSTYIHQ